MADLSRYDGSSGVLIDTNVWIDCMDPNSAWHDWSINQLQSCSERAPLHINLIVYTELLVPAPDVALIDAMLDVYETRRSQLPWNCAALAAAAFARYRKRGGVRTKPLPDFFIGAHAAVSNLSVLTRDAAPYKSEFPPLVIIHPQ